MGIQVFGRGSVTAASIADNSITDSDINTSAAIAYSKLDLEDSIVDDDIAAHTSTKITITTKAQLNAAIMYTDALNTIGDAVNFAFNTTTGTKFGTAASQKIGFYNATPVVQRSTIADINSGTLNSGDATTDTVIGDIRTKLNTLFAGLEALGLFASA